MTSTLNVGALAFFIAPKGCNMEFLTSFAVIVLSALLLGSICKKLRLPSLVGMLIIGIVFSPHLLNLISPSILGISPDLRQLALIIILTRAGLNLNFADLKKNGRSAILLCFLPAVFEIAAYVGFGVLILDIDPLSAAILGSVMAAVSPAVIVPRMLKLKEERYGTKKGIPDMIIAGASVDDVFVIVLFTALCAMSEGQGFSLNVLWQVPVSIVLGIGVGILLGYLFVLFVKKIHLRDSIKVIIMLSVSCLLIAFENLIEVYVPFSGLLAIIAFAAMMFQKHEVCAKRLSVKYNKLWLFAEIVLFVLVGAEVNLSFLGASVLKLIPVILLALVFRIVGVFCCLLGSKLNRKERLFAAIAYTPKATVQAAIGAIPFSLCLPNGELILCAAVLAILITAPIGAFAIDLSYNKLLEKETVTKTCIP